ncbi:MAG: hypothetical protein IJO01_03395 [Oscillospiraceae bacterium]|nr:hypothetical protein [Oscillospiraceae bacterium]
MFRKVFVLIMAAVMLFSLSACENEKQKQEEKLKNPVTEKTAEDVLKQDRSKAVSFRLGTEGEPGELSIGDKIGNWVLESFEKYEDDGIEAVFKGREEIECLVRKSPMASDVPIYVFEVAKKDINKFPVYCEDERYGISFMSVPESAMDESFADQIGSDTKMCCKVVITEYRYNYLPMSVHSQAVIESAELFVDIETEEPELIAENIAVLNELVKDTYGIDADWGNDYCRMYKTKPNGADFDRSSVPDALEPWEVFEGIALSADTKYNGMYIDMSCEGAYKAMNFSSKTEVFENLCRFIVPDLVRDSEFEEHVMDFEGKVYLLRFSRGYGAKSYGNTEIVWKTETKIIAESMIYYMGCEEAGTAEIKLEKFPEGWKIVSVEDNYYRK